MAGKKGAKSGSGKGGRKPKPAKAAAAKSSHEQTAREGNANAPPRQLPTANTLKTLLKLMENASTEASSINGSARKEIGNAVRRKHLHKRAFAAVRALSKLTPEQLDEHIDHFEHYMKELGIYARADSVQKLPGIVTAAGDDEGEEEGDGEETTAGADAEGAGNVVQHPAAASAAKH